MKKLRILQLTKFYSPFWGGIESVTYELTEAINNEGYACDVLCANESVKSTEELFNGKYKVWRVGSLGRLFSTSIAPKLIFKLNEIKNDYDIIHVHFPDPLTALALFICRPKCKIIVHWHSDVIKQRMALFFFLPLQNWVLRRADKIVGTSPKYINESPYLSHLKDKCVPIPIGISSLLDRVDNDKYKQIKCNYENKIIIFALGRLVYYKGFEYLIDAANYLTDDYVILIGGEGPLREHYQKQIKRDHLEERVILLGNIALNELAAYFKACDIFCLPSVMHSEAFGVAQIEAMSMRKPIIATKIPFSGVSWVNEHGVSGFNVPVMDSKSIAKKIEMLANDPLLYKRLADGALERYNKKFTSRKMILEILKLYRNVYSSGKRRLLDEN